MIENGDLQSPLLKLTRSLRFDSANSVPLSRIAELSGWTFAFRSITCHQMASGQLSQKTEQNLLIRRQHSSLKVNEEFFSLAQSADFRSMARGVLIRSYFEPTEQVALASLVNLSIADLASTRSTVCENESSFQSGRDVRFRLDIVAAYNYTCALTGYRVTTIDGASIIDAAHIHQFSESRNNDPKNGIALCKNAHWMFDQGLWSLDDDYRVIVAHSAFDEDTRDQKSLRDFHGLKITLPTSTNLWPDPSTSLGTESTSSVLKKPTRRLGEPSSGASELVLSEAVPK